MSQVQLLELEVTADPGVLLRVVSLCHKRGIAIASLQYESAPASGRIRSACPATRPRPAGPAGGSTRSSRCWPSGSAAPRPRG